MGNNFIQMTGIVKRDSRTSATLEIATMTKKVTPSGREGRVTVILQLDEP